MATMDDWTKRLLDKYRREQQALVNVLQERIKWHRMQSEKTKDADEKQAHEELLLTDLDTLEELRDKYELQQKRFKKRYKFTLPTLDISI